MKNKLFCRHNAHPLEFIENVHGDDIVFRNCRSIWKCVDCGKRFYKKYVYDVEKVSDGYHTFEELYHHRAVLFSVICNQNKDIAWKSKLHYDNTMYDGMFIVGIETPDGQATYHYDIKKYWDMFDVKELPNAPMWDGHTSDDAIERISHLK